MASTNFEDLIGRSDTAGKPAAGVPGRLWYDTTLAKLQRDNGSDWEDVEPAGLDNPMTTEGDLILGGASGTPARLAIGTNGYVLTSNGTTAAWAEPSAGGEALPLDTISDYGNGDDFAGTTLDGGWSSLQSTALTSVDRSVGGFCILKNANNTSGQDRGIQRAFAPAGDFLIKVKIQHVSLISNYQWAALFVGAADPSDGGSGNRLQCQVVYNGGFKFKFAKYAAGSETLVFDSYLSAAGLLADGAISFPIWLSIRRAGSTLYAGISMDGVQFVEQATTTTIAFTVETCGLILAEATATLDIRATFDYIATS